MHYHTVFDLSESGYKSASFRAFGLIFVTLGGIMLAWHRRQAEAGKRRRTMVALVLLLLAVFWTATVFGSTYRQYLALLQARSEGHAGVVEGPVSGFEPMPSGGQAVERFCVQEQCFSYAAGMAGSGRSHGEPIREGLPVRVTYVGDRIVRLEVGR